MIQLARLTWLSFVEDTIPSPWRQASHDQLAGGCVGYDNQFYPKYERV